MIYVLEGSEDGYMGVYTSKKKALATAIKYCSEHDITKELFVSTQESKYDTIFVERGNTRVSIIVDEIIR